MNIKLLVILFISVLLLFVLYKLYYNDNFIEHFGVLEKMKNISKRKIKNRKEKFANTIKKKASFDDLFKATENMDPNRYSMTSIFNNLSDYKESFNKEKFKNNSKNTSESFEKFALYKEKFFELF